MNLDEAEFEQLMLKTDDILAAKNMKISARPLNAVINIFQNKGASGALFEPRNESSDFPVTSANLSNHVHKWYENKYADLLKVDFSLGSFPIAINGAIYRCKLPMLVGQHLIVGSKGALTGKGILNAVDCIESLPTFIREKLDSHTENLLQVLLATCLDVSTELRARNSTILNSAVSDIAISCEQLLATNINASLSAWHSLQFAEKVLKSYIVQFEEPKFTHNIKDLKKKAMKFGYVPDNKINWDAFNFNASVRYDAKMISLSNALTANHEAWRIGFNVLKQLND